MAQSQIVQVGHLFLIVKMGHLFLIVQVGWRRDLSLDPLVFEKKEQNEKQGMNKNIKRKFEATTKEKREIRIVYESQNAEDDKKKKTTVKIIIDEEQLTKGATSTLKYAGIPIKKKKKRGKRRRRRNKNRRL